jgi:hypothetical protein
MVLAWIAAAVSAFIATEWMIHLPALDVVSFRDMHGYIHMERTKRGALGWCARSNQQQLRKE